MPNEYEISMLRAARDAGITSREEMANFMAQMGHESTGFTRLEEGFRYTRGIHQIPVRSAWREGEQALEAARQEALQGRPQELGRLMYGGRMGNDDAGDGYLYRGRGYTQLTGENNYQAAETALNLALVENPALAADRGNAEQIAIWFWQNEVPAQDRDDVSRATQAINNGENGLDDRLNRYDAWHAVLTPEFITEFDAGHVRAGTTVAPAAGRPAMEDGALRRLESGDEVRQLNDDLRTLNIRTDRNRSVPAGDVFTRETEQAVRRFQEQQSTPVTGRADPATLESIGHSLQQHRNQQFQNGQPPNGVMQPQLNPPDPNDQQADRSGNAQAFSTGDPDLDRLAAALFANDEAAISHISAQIERSPQVQAFEHVGRELATAQERDELQHQEMAQRMQGHVMRI
jgi:putative chitinase